MLLNYLMNYGWLFMFLMGCISIIFYFGFNPFVLHGGVMCKVSGGLVCRDIQASQNEISVQIENQRSSGIELVSANFQNTKCGSNNVFQTPIRMSYNEKYTLHFSCNKFPKITRGNLVIEYKNLESGLTFKEKGDIKVII